METRASHRLGHFSATGLQSQPPELGTGIFAPARSLPWCYWSKILELSELHGPPQVSLAHLRTLLAGLKEVESKGACKDEYQQVKLEGFWLFCVHRVRDQGIRVLVQKAIHL